MSAQVTEAHRKLAADLCRSATGSNRALHHVPKFAQLIADSEALACAKLRAEVRAVLKIVNEQTARAELAEAEVERLRECCDQTSALCGKFITEDDGTDLIPNSARIANALARLKARADRAEAELAGIRALANRRNKRDHSQDTTHQLVAALDQALDIAQAELADERAIVSRIWVQLGSPTYEQLKGRSIYCLIDELKAELATERARLDWLESKCPILWSLVDHATGPYWLLTDFPGYTEETASQHKTARAAIDSAMKEGGK